MTNKKMKDSGVEWIGQIPEDWKIQKIKNMFNIMNGNGFPEKLQGENQGDYPFYKVSDINRRGMYVDSSANYVSKSVANKYNFNIIPKNAILIAKIGEALKKNHRKINNSDCIIDNNMEALITDEDYKYSYYLLSVIDMLWFDNNGTIPSINNEKMRNFKIPFIKIKKQKVIANFLDEKTEEIDNIIVKTKEVIEEYKKYKQSLITETVTKGLDKNLPMKDSGIEWIGDIPEHWDVIKLKYIFNIKKDIANELGYDVLSITQKGFKIRDLNNNEGQLSMDYSKYQIVNKSDFAMNHMDLLTGWVDLSKTLGVTSPDYRVFNIEDTSKYKNKYYLRLLQLCYTNKIFYGFGQGVSNLGRWRLQTEAFNNIYYPVPPLKEQEQIASYLDEKTNQIDQIIAFKEKLIEEMKAYKKSLIYEIVTGKREVE